MVLETNDVEAIRQTDEGWPQTLYFMKRPRSLCSPKKSTKKGTVKSQRNRPNVDCRYILSFEKFNFYLNPISKFFELVANILSNV